MPAWPLPTVTWNSGNWRSATFTWSRISGSFSTSSTSMARRLSARAWRRGDRGTHASMPTSLDPPCAARCPHAVNILAGVDEAGLGPILGPLVVGGVALAGPAGTDPWQLLRRHVARR